MVLHVFNPEHDLALASGLTNYTAPRAGRQLRHDLGFLPVFWAREGDVVLVEDIEVARRGLRQLGANASERLNAADTGIATLGSVASYWRGAVSPWGWDAALRASLLRMGVPSEALPTEEAIETIRSLSHRRTAARLLQRLRTPGTVGEAVECHTEAEVCQFIESHPQAVLKAPWSSSGRGVKFIGLRESASGRLSSYPFQRSEALAPNRVLFQRSEALVPIGGWLRNVLKAQGSIMAEPYYNKVKDFALEFELCDGKARYMGLSLFHAEKGAYIGNVLATEAAKREKLSQHISIDIVDRVKEEIIDSMERMGITEEIRKIGSIGPMPFGVDMMVVSGSDASNLLHPCVELNLRRTMGHVAIALEAWLNPEGDDTLLQCMSITFKNNQYQLTINDL